MGSSGLSMESRSTLLAKWQSIYKQHRFLDAYKASAEYWTKSTAIDDLSAEELIFAARVVSRLGGGRLSRHLYRKARERAPELALVRYFTRHVSGNRSFLLDELLEFEKNPELGGDDNDLRASWQADRAYTYAALRDFSRAHELLKRAHEISPENAWVWSQEADVYGMGDQWQDSLQSAESGFRADPHSPWPILSLGTALLNLGKIREAVERLSRAAETSQFSYIVQTACWYHCALAETLEGDEQREVLAAAHKLAERIEPMAPLADREFRAALARTRLDLAEMSDDHLAMEHWAREARSPFHRKVLANLKANPSGKRIRLPYRRTIQKHVECVPTSISSALSATGVDLSVEELAREVTFGGTAEWAAADWLREKGFHVRFFSATPEVATRLLSTGIGFTVSWDDDESGHAVAIVGIDHAAGTVIVHDPSAFRSTEYLLSAFTPDHGPLGVLAMATVSKTHAEILDSILPAEAEVVEAAEAQRRAHSINGPASARPIVDAIEKRFPDHPGTLYLRALQNLEDGRVGRSLGDFRKLMEMFPKSPAVRERLMASCRSLGDTALLRETLKSVIETGKVPGVNSQNEWATPHQRYFYDYADLLRFSAETQAKSESLLRKTLTNNSRSSGAWHVLADLRWSKRDHESAVLAYRIASTLAEHNEHYASAYEDVLCRKGRVPEAMEWLRARAEKLGSAIHGVSTWITYVGTLEDWGNPELALQVCRDVLKRFGASPPLLVFAVPFFARMGQWSEAERWLRELEETQAEARFREAAVYFSQMHGLTLEALGHAEAWVNEVPLAIPARRKLLWLISTVQGHDAALSRAAQWMRERPENEDFEDLFCEYAESPVWRKLRVLSTRVKRNRDDAWAWRELVFAAISQFESSDETHRRRLQQRLVRYLAEAERLTAGDAPTLRAQGLWQEAQCNWKAAHTCYLEAIQRDPGNSWSYDRVFELSARFPAAEQRALWSELEPIWLGNPGHLPNCLKMMRHVNDLFGPRETEKIITNWQKLRPDDPNVAEALADLLLDFGHGRSDAIRALELLRPTSERYPYHSGLRFSLARALRATGDDSAAGQVFEELVHYRPDNLSALIQLAWIREREGRTDEALRLLSEAAKQEPQNVDPLDTQAQILIENDRYYEAVAIIEDGLRRLPRSVRMYQRAIALFARCGQDEKAVEAARQGIVAYPRGAYLWLLLGKTHREHPQFAAPGEIEHCLRKSLQLNHGLYESADLLTIILTEQRQYDFAFQVLSDVELRMTNPSQVQGRRAWIRRQSGGRRQAVTELGDVLERFPGYAWGWSLLLDWLEEDKEWDLSKKLLGSVPPQMIADLAFRRRRLQLLEKARAEASSLDPEWSQLLDDFPEDVPLYLHRYDFLRKVFNQWGEAAATLDRIAPVAGDDVYFTTRLADVRCHQERFDEAVQCALNVCFAPVEHSIWPVNRVWEVFSSAGKEQMLAESFQTKLKEGGQPTRRAVARFVEHLVSQERPSSFATRPFRQTRLHHVTREVLSLMKAAQESRWRNEFHPGDSFAILNTNKYSRLVIRLWKGLGDRGKDSDTQAWAEAGRAMIECRRYRMARALFRDWRTRRGVQMWSLANYALSFPRTRKHYLEELASTCRDALADLPHDHCARYLACLQAEACALAGDKEGLLAVWRDRRAYFDGELKKGEYFKTQEKHLLSDLPELAEAVERNDRKTYRRIRWRLRYKRLWTQNRRKGLGIIARIVWVLVMIGISMGIFWR
ncbi:MAG TPA: tetratricopeptide repeat protein [Bryocella sp.]|nr:tetratricopeptide repeat protein [Bryocella sp.]